MPSESDDDPISAVKRGDLTIHCARMELVQNTSTQPGRYIGNGYIRQNDNGVIEFTLYATEIANYQAYTALLMSPMTGQAGTLIQADEAYTLIATSYRQDTWKAERILELDFQTDITTLRLYGKIYVLRRERKAVVRDPTHRITMHFLDDIGIPCPVPLETTSKTFDGAIFDVAGDKHFRIQKLDDEIVVQINSEAAFLPNFDARVEEAFSYVMARSMLWRTLETHDGDDDILSLSSPIRQSINPQLGKPLVASQWEEMSMVWRLFGKYLEYVTTESDTSISRRCSRYLHNAREASANSIDAWTIGLCVAVENLSRLVDYVEPDADKKQKLAVQRLVRRWLKCKRWSNTRVGQRAAGLLSNLSDARLKDRLEPLVQSGHVDSTHIKIWSKLRNPSVHTGGNIDDNTTPRQKWLDDIGAVTVLMYHLTFYLMGYAESYTDYTQHNWPSAPYPLPAPASSWQPSDSSSGRGGLPKY
jgi:hypothetical protein